MGRLQYHVQDQIYTKSSLLEGPSAYFVRKSERNGFSIYLLGTYQLPGSLPNDENVEVEDTVSGFKEFRF